MPTSAPVHVIVSKTIDEFAEPEAPVNMAISRFRNSQRDVADVVLAGASENLDVSHKAYEPAADNSNSGATSERTKRIFSRVWNVSPPLC